MEELGIPSTIGIEWDRDKLGHNYHDLNLSWYSLLVLQRWKPWPIQLDDDWNPWDLEDQIPFGVNGASWKIHAALKFLYIEYRNAIFSPYLLRWFKPKMGMVTMSDCTCFNWELLTKGLLDGFPIVYTYTITTHLKLLVRGTIPKCKIYFWGPPLNVNLVAERPPVGRVFKIPSKCKLTFSSPPSKTPWQY